MLIWMHDRWLRDSLFTVSWLDRTLEHGLGLFETLRTWNGRAPLLDRHLDRMKRSATALNLHLDPSELPDLSVFRTILEQDHEGRDAMFRITLTGGLSPTFGSVVVMRSAPLPPKNDDSEGLTLLLCDSPVSPFDPLSRHKTLNYWSRRLVYEKARSQGADEALLRMTTSCDSVAIEGSRTNLFLVIDDRLLTADVDAPILPGIMRGLVLELAVQEGMQVDRVGWSELQVVPGRMSLDRSEEVFLTNSVRGILPVGRVGEAEFGSAGPWTRRLQGALERWLDGERR